MQKCNANITLLVFQAPLLPLVILGFSLLLGNSVQIDLIGITVGHMYYFLEDVFPNQPGGFRKYWTEIILSRLLIILIYYVFP